ncbi:MAG: mycofactocin-associated electron transfer flavoprotein beta subunit [Actinomycetota bacterium]
MTFIAACMKWVSGRPEIDPLSGEVRLPSGRFGGVSAADQAALEVALQLGSQRSMHVIAIAVGDSQCEAALRDALAAGAQRAIRIDASRSLSSAETAQVLALALGDAALILCGDYSFDRGSGSVPAFLAAELGISQALGVVSLMTHAEDITATRRLDGGRREHLRVGDRAVISVEGSVAQLRRASLTSTLTARISDIRVIPSSTTARQVNSTTKPFRPRPRTLDRPVGDTALERLHSITNVSLSSTRGEQIELSAAKSATYILETLARWGYLEQAR